jgi:hypothetical protein
MPLMPLMAVLICLPLLRTLVCYRPLQMMRWSRPPPCLGGPDLPGLLALRSRTL